MLSVIDGDAILETSRLQLEPLRAAHAPLLYPLLLDPQLYRFIPHNPPPSLAHLATRFATLERRTSPAGDELWLNWAVRLKRKSQYLGRVEVTVLAERTAYLAYEVAPQYWGNGYATEACRRVLELLTQTYGVERVLAEVDTRNLASIRLLERLGFARVAERPNADYFKGSASDEYTYELRRAGAAEARRG